MLQIKTLVRAGRVENLTEQSPDGIKIKSGGCP